MIMFSRPDAEKCSEEELSRNSNNTNENKNLVLLLFFKTTFIKRAKNDTTVT